MFKDLLERIVDDFFAFINAAFNKNNFDVRNYIDSRNLEEIKKRIYIFWNLIDNIYKKNNFPDDIILDVLKFVKMQSYTSYDFLVDKICTDLDGYDKDNSAILNYLNNNRYDELNKLINEGKADREHKNEEEEEEDDEEEIQQNLERLDLDYYIDELEQKENENNNNEIKEKSEENDNEYDYEYDDIKRLIPLNDEKFNYLLNSTQIFSD